MNRMTQEDWNKYLSKPPLQGEIPENNYHAQMRENPTDAELKDIEMEDEDVQIIKHLGMKRETDRAKFFVTKIDGFGYEHGAWVPKSAIIEEDEKDVVIKEWCRLNYIDWNG